ncbi:MAG: response regulator transcription factor [Acidobacteriia bacterium]|nr:response regulator transcription factor [Terriglobia bacterium]
MKRILVVEDEPAIAMVLEDDLTAEGYQVVVVTDGETASERALHEQFDAILLDVMLPRRDGFDVCRDLRRAGVRTPIMMLTAKSHEAEKVLGLELGADDYVTKPYSARELRARVKALLRRGEGESQQVCRFGDCEIHYERGEVRRLGKPLEMTPLEYKLLALMARRPGRVFTREQLLDEVWGRDVYITARVVDNQITNLRKKIEMEPGRPRYLVSVRGLGYRLDVTEP